MEAGAEKFKVGDKFKRYVVQTFTGVVTIKKVLPSGRYRLDNGEMGAQSGNMLFARNSVYHNPVRYIAITRNAQGDR